MKYRLSARHAERLDAAAAALQHLCKLMEPGRPQASAGAVPGSAESTEVEALRLQVTQMAAQIAALTETRPAPLSVGSDTAEAQLTHAQVSWATVGGIALAAAALTLAVSSLLRRR